MVAALKQEGFGVLTDIGLQDPLKQKLGAEFRSCRSLGEYVGDYLYRKMALRR